jgi:hypothetical protein
MAVRSAPAIKRNSARIMFGGNDEVERRVNAIQSARSNESQASHPP